MRNKNNNVNSKLTTTIEWTADTLKSSWAATTVEIAPNGKLEGALDWNFQTYHMGGFHINVRGGSPRAAAAAVDSATTASATVCQGHRKPGCQARAVNNKLKCCRPLHHLGTWSTTAQTSG